MALPVDHKAISEVLKRLDKFMSRMGTSGSNTGGSAPKKGVMSTTDKKGKTKTHIRRG